MAHVRPAKPEDLGAITRIYNQVVLTSTADFETEPWTEERQRTWLDGRSRAHPVLVAEEEMGAVVGWASLKPWSQHRGYESTAEVSVYVDEGHRRLGVGRALLEVVLDAGRSAGIHVVVAQITHGNEASVRLHQAVGFVQVGVLHEVGQKFGQLLDVVVMERVLPPVAAQPKQEATTRAGAQE